MAVATICVRGRALKGGAKYDVVGAKGGWADNRYADSLAKAVGWINVK